MARYHVEMDKLEEHGDEVLKSNDQLKNDIEDIKKIIEKMEWEGHAADSYSELMKDKMKKLEKVTGLIDIFGNFMKKGSEGFNDVFKQIQESFATNGRVCPKCHSPLVNGLCPTHGKV